MASGATSDSGGPNTTPRASKSAVDHALSPTAASAALQSLKSQAQSRSRTKSGTASPSAEIKFEQTDASHVDETKGLRIQAPASGQSKASSSSGAIAGPMSASPASGLSAPTSPADDGLDTPDGGPESSKRRRVTDDGGNMGGASPATSTPPLFLEKTYEMLDKCAPSVACWSPSGDSFIVKNPSDFAENVIPIYFKHKNFSSFVRQLNFYGFRKVRVVDPEITGGVDPKDWWEFRHEKFIRGCKALLKEIKRRSLPSHSNAAVSPGGPESAGRSFVERAEMEELRSEVVSLREQIQTLNKHMFSVMQIMMMRNGSTPVPGPGPGPAPVSGFASPHLHPPHHMPPQYSFVAGLPPPHPSQSGHNGPTSSKGDKRGGGPPLSASVSTPTSSGTPSGGYTMRPLPSIGGSGMPGGGYISALVTAADHAAVDWDAYARHAFHSGQLLQTPRSSGPQSTSAEVASSVPAVVGLKRSRSQPNPSQPLHTPRSPSSVTFLDNPEAAVRHMSMLVTRIRDELLQSIISRTLGFVGTQPPPANSSSNKKAVVTPEVEAVAEAVAGDIQLKLSQINEAEASTQGKPPGSCPPSETSHMYRVEILKFVSKELPRAMQDSVEKRLPAPVKKTLNRSLLALMVQKAQGALERQMRVETTANTSPSGSNGSSSNSSK